MPATLVNRLKEFGLSDQEVTTALSTPVPGFGNNVAFGPMHPSESKSMTRIRSCSNLRKETPYVGFMGPSVAAQRRLKKKMQGSHRIHVEIVITKTGIKYKM